MFKHLKGRGKKTSEKNHNPSDDPLPYHSFAPKTVQPEFYASSRDPMDDFLK